MEQLSQTDLALPSFYVAIEAAADTIPDFSEKQKFLNTVYEQFFQRFAVERADTFGIAYTPQEIVHREQTSKSTLANHGMFGRRSLVSSQILTQNMLARST